MTQPDIEIVIKEDFTYRECSDVANDVFKKTQWLFIPKPEAEPDYRKKQESKNQDFLKSQSNEPLEYASSSAVELEKEKNTREGLTILESS
ncbi:hypothetical protein POMI540_2334 [Schizosaccharomyces pombe]